VPTMSGTLSWLLAATLAFGVAPLAAQDAAPSGDATQAPLPSWVVLVLQPIAGERVRPVTGVVVSAEGLILVPSDFAAPGDTLIVLDGGSDIINSGRAAFVQSEHPEVGVDVLTAPLLRRNPVPLSSAPLDAGTQLRLGAFPPAEQIAAGAPPLWRTITLGAGPSLAAGSNLPQVSGPLMDACGYMLGFHSAPVVQSLDVAATPGITWKPALVQLLESVPNSLREVACNPAEAIAVTETETQSVSPSAPPDETAVAAPISNPPASTAGAQTSAVPATTSAAMNSPATGTAAVPAKPWSSNTFWLALLGFTTAVLLGWLWMRKRSAVKVEEASIIAPHDRRGSVEVAWTGRHNQPAGPGAATSDSRLEITGKLADGTDFTAGCLVNGAAFSVIVGRGRVDIVIDHASIHREQLTLSGSRDHMTVSDLGSASGTWVNRVPCLPGEIFFVGEEDTVFAGDVSFMITVKPLPYDSGGVATRS